MEKNEGFLPINQIKKEFLLLEKVTRRIYKVIYSIKIKKDWTVEPGLGTENLPSDKVLLAVDNRRWMVPTNPAGDMFGAKEDIL